MIRKDFLLKFKLNEALKEDLADKNSIEDDNYLLHANRPIKEKDIVKLPDSKIENFVDKILFDHNSNKLLFSSNYKKEIEILKKSQSIMNSLKFRDKKIQEKKCRNLQKEREKKEVISQAKNEIDIIKKMKNQERNEKIRGNEDFYKEIIEERKSMISPENKYRKERFTKIYSNIKKKIDYIILPSVKLEFNDVFSRLHHNAVFTNAMLNQRSTHNLMSSIVTKKDSMTSLRRNYSVKNVIANIGKEFTTKITPDQISKCFGKISGGPAYKSVEKNLDNLPNTYSVEEGQHANIIQQAILKNGNTLLHDAILNQKFPLIEYLLEKGCDINVKNDDGNTPLHVACLATDSIGYKKEIIDLLIEWGADFTIKNNQNHLAIDLAEDDIRKYLGNEIKILQNQKRESASRSK